MSATGASEPGTQPQKEVCLLSLDGGGVRGISTLMILKILMESIDPKNPPKPCDCFDMIGGTSTGGLIALMLGRLRMSVNECIDAYEKMAHDVFTKPRNPVISKGRLRGRFDHEALERHVKQLLESRAISADALLDDRLNPNSCKTFVCATFAGSDENIILSSYNNRQRNHQRDQDLLKTTKIWEAARATSAVGRFFGPITIGDETFFDKASGESNPIETMLVEAQDMYRRDKSLPDQHIKCIVSIGTGLYFKSDLGHIDRSLKKIAIDAELYAQNFRHKNSKLFDSRRAFRFNVHSGLENIDLEEVAKWGEIKAATRLYMQEEQVHEQIKDFVKNMQTRELNVPLMFSRLEADMLGAQMMATRKEDVEEDLPDTLYSMSDLALISKKQGQEIEAEELHQSGREEWQSRKSICDLRTGYGGVITQITTALNSLESVKLPPPVLVALDDTLLRLELWEDELSAEEDEPFDSIFDFIEARYKDFSKLMVEGLDILSERITALLDWREDDNAQTLAPNLETLDPSPPFVDLSEALDNLIDIAEIIRAQPQQRVMKKRVENLLVSQ